MANIYARVANAREAGALTDPVRYDLFRPTGSGVERKSLEDWLADFSAQLGGGSGVSINLELETTASIATTTIPAQVDIVTTLGYAALGDGGGGTFKIVGSTPTHPGYRTSSNGKICEITGPQIDIRALGGVPGGGASTSKQAYLDWIATGVATKIPLYLPPYTFDCGDAYIAVTSAPNIRGEGKRSNLRRSVRNTTGGIFLRITTSEAPVLENFQIEYSAATWPAHPGGVIDSDAGINYAVYLDSCDGPVVNDISIIGEWYVALAFADCDNITVKQPHIKRHINRGILIGAGVKNCINGRILQPVVDGSSNGVTPRADYGINFNTVGGYSITDFNIIQPQVSGCADHAIGISASCRFCRVIGGSIYNCLYGALIQYTVAGIPQYCSFSEMTIENTQYPIYFTNAYYCDATNNRIIGSNYSGNAPQFMARLNGCLYCYVHGNRADNMTIAGVVCDSGGANPTNSYGHVISDNFILMSAGTGFSSDSPSGGTWWTGNRVIGAITPFATLGTHPAASNNITT